MKNKFGTSKSLENTRKIHISDPKYRPKKLQIRFVFKMSPTPKLRQIRENSKFLPLEEINAKEIQEFRGPRQVYFDFRPSNVEKNVKTFD